VALGCVSLRRTYVPRAAEATSPSKPPQALGTRTVSTVPRVPRRPQPSPAVTIVSQHWSLMAKSTDDYGRAEETDDHR
jgi:hypothetical protein